MTKDIVIVTPSDVVRPVIPAKVMATYCHGASPALDSLGPAAERTGPCYHSVPAPVPATYDGLPHRLRNESTMKDGGFDRRTPTLH